MENLRKTPYNIRDFVGKNLGNKEGNIKPNLEYILKSIEKRDANEEFTT